MSAGYICQRLRSIKQEIREQRELIARLEQGCTIATEYDCHRVQSQHSDRVQRTVVLIDEKKQKLVRLQQDVQTLQKAFAAMLDTLENDIQKDVLRLYYDCGYTWVDIAAHMHRSVGNVYAHRARALKILNHTPGNT